MPTCSPYPAPEAIPISGISESPHYFLVPTHIEKTYYDIANFELFYERKYTHKRADCSKIYCAHRHAFREWIKSCEKAVIKFIGSRLGVSDLRTNVFKSRIYMREVNY